MLVSSRHRYRRRRTITVACCPQLQLSNGVLSTNIMIKIVLVVCITMYLFLYFNLVQLTQIQNYTGEQQSKVLPATDPKTSLPKGSSNARRLPSQSNHHHLHNSSFAANDIETERSIERKKKQDKRTWWLLRRLPSVDFFSCCGLGHRLTRLADVYFVAKQLNFTLRVFFGFCGHEEIFSSFFATHADDNVNTFEDPDNNIRKSFWTSQEMFDMTSSSGGEGGGSSSTSSFYNMYITINNNVPHFKKLVRVGSTGLGDESRTGKITTVSSSNKACQCFESRFQSDIEIYSKLRDRFRGRETVNEFRKQHFDGKTVIGLHVRAGNGETGNFERKNRTITNIDEWTTSMAQQLLSIKSEIEAHNNDDRQQPPPPILLFIATDTASMISTFQKLLGENIPVVHLSQTRTEDGQGVLFGEVGRVTVEGDQCMGGWNDVISDMMLLSYADILIAGRPSSLTQSLPMTMVLSKPVSERKVRRSFCEVNPDATRRVCYDSLMDWCCNGTTSFSLDTIQRYDYRNFPIVEQLNLDMYSDRLQTRPRPVDGCWPTPGFATDCLPLEMPNPKRLKKLAERREQQLKGITEQRQKEN